MPPNSRAKLPETVTVCSGALRIKRPLMTRVCSVRTPWPNGLQFLGSLYHCYARTWIFYKKRAISLKSVDRLLSYGHKTIVIMANLKKKSHLVTWLSSSKCAVVYQICSKSDDFYRAMRGLCCRKDVRLSVRLYVTRRYSVEMSPQTFSLSGRHILVLNGMTIFRGNRLTRASNAGLWTNRDFLTIISLYLYYTGWAKLNGASLHFCL